jgi:hypothetical protein
MMPVMTIMTWPCMGAPSHAVRPTHGRPPLAGRALVRAPPAGTPRCYRKNCDGGPDLRRYEPAHPVDRIEGTTMQNLESCRMMQAVERERVLERAERRAAAETVLRRGRSSGGLLRLLGIRKAGPRRAPAAVARAESRTERLETPDARRTLPSS